MKNTIIVHGGAWDIPQDIEKPSLEGVEKTAKLGMDCLLKGGSAVDAVELAIRTMEDSSIFDAGVGSVLNTEGDIELDAGLMDGKNLNVGAVAAVRKIRNPISLARKVMEKSSHVLLVGEGAGKFAQSQGIQKYTALAVEREIERWKKLRSEYVHTMRFEHGADTVGAVAVDSKGNYAAGNSTGGVPFKLPGRVGDSCLVGCGFYADNNIGAVAATGHGESIMKLALSKTICNFLEKGLNAQIASEKGIALLEKKVEGHAGVIVLDKKGEVGVFYNTPKMARAHMTEGMNNPASSI